MGYTTDFKGAFKLDKRLTAAHAMYLHTIARTRRMKRNGALAEALPDPAREAAQLPIGPEGAYFVGGGEYHDEIKDKPIVDCNCPPRGQPGLWCNWVPDRSWQAIVWNRAEKFYDYIEWIEYLIAHFLRPWGYVVNGEMKWFGEQYGDAGVIKVVANEVEANLVPDPRDPARFQEDFDE